MERAWQNLCSVTLAKVAILHSTGGWGGLEDATLPPSQSCFLRAWFRGPLYPGQSTLNCIVVMASFPKGENRNRHRESAQKAQGIVSTAHPWSNKWQDILCPHRRELATAPGQPYGHLYFILLTSYFQFSVYKCILYFIPVSLDKVMICISHFTKVLWRSPQN